jgi:hypothetical protein
MKFYRIAQQVITAYHGTCSRYYDIIKEKGLVSPYLANTYELAKYYSERLSYQKVSYDNKIEYDFGSPIVLKVIVTDLNHLRYDPASMTSPVMANKSDRDEAWEKAEIEHPEWNVNGVRRIPLTEWEISWNAVGAVRYMGTIYPDQISVALN